MSVTSELRKQSREELQKRLLEKRDELFKLRMQKASGQNPSKIGQEAKLARRSIARIKTILNQQAEGGK